jgi:hypothetical protein
VVFGAVGAFVWARNSSDSGTPTGGTETTAGTERPRKAMQGVEAEIVSAARLRSLAASARRSIYWAGPRPGTRLEFTQKSDGTTYVRYLTGSATAGAPGGNYVVIATYAQPDAIRRVKRTAEQEHFRITKLPSGAVAVTKPGRPQNIHVAYPGLPYQIEVYAPRPAEARKIVFGGAVQPVG